MKFLWQLLKRVGSSLESVCSSLERVCCSLERVWICLVMGNGSLVEENKRNRLVMDIFVLYVIFTKYRMQSKSFWFGVDLLLRLRFVKLNVTNNLILFCPDLQWA